MAVASRRHSRLQARRRSESALTGTARSGREGDERAVTPQAGPGRTGVRSRGRGAALGGGAGVRREGSPERMRHAPRAPRVSAEAAAHR